jgi:hypothetical protein
MLALDLKASPIVGRELFAPPLCQAALNDLLVLPLKLNAIAGDLGRGRIFRSSFKFLRSGTPSRKKIETILIAGPL